MKKTAKWVVFLPFFGGFCFVFFVFYWIRLFLSLESEAQANGDG